MDDFIFLTKEIPCQQTDILTQRAMLGEERKHHRMERMYARTPIMGERISLTASAVYYRPALVGP
jgi:hypothetical protein